MVATKKKTPRKAKKRPKKPTASEVGHIIADLRPLAVRIQDLVPDPANARVHPSRNLEATRASLVRYGQRKPVVVNRNGSIIEAGNGTYECGKKLGWKWIAAVFVEDDPATAAGYSIADNRTAELAAWDPNALHKLLDSLQQDIPVLDLGFNEAELKMLLNPTGLPGADEVQFPEYGEDAADGVDTKRVTCPKCDHDFIP